MRSAFCPDPVCSVGSPIYPAQFRRSLDLVPRPRTGYLFSIIYIMRHSPSKCTPIKVPSLCGIGNAHAYFHGAVFDYPARLSRTAIARVWNLPTTKLPDERTAMIAAIAAADDFR